MIPMSTQVGMTVPTRWGQNLELPELVAPRNHSRTFPSGTRDSLSQFALSLAHDESMRSFGLDGRRSDVLTERICSASIQLLAWV